MATSLGAGRRANRLLPIWARPHATGSYRYGRYGGPGLAGVRAGRRANRLLPIWARRLLAKFESYKDRVVLWHIKTAYISHDNIHEIDTCTNIVWLGYIERRYAKYIIGGVTMGE